MQAYDPEGMREAAHMLEGVEFRAGPYEAAEGADAVVLLTEWDQFRALDLERLRGLMRAPVLVDLRNVYRSDDLRRAGFQHHGVGRGEAAAAQDP